MKKLFVVLLLLTSYSFAQPEYTDQDVKICKEKFEFAASKELKAKPVNDVIAEIGKSFIGLDYAAHTLEKEGEEHLVINLTGLDCTTFLENAVVFARCIKSGKTTFEDYQNELTKLRYRNGKIEQYPSRLHYFSDWIFENSKKGIVEDITAEIGGKPYPNKVGFMSKNRDKYAQISTNDKFHAAIKEKEAEINLRTYTYIPKSDIKNVEKEIGNGFLIAITSGVEGLDIAHVGIAVKMETGRLHFLHAPIVGAKVQITKEPLYDYLAKNKKQTGIMVLKPLEPLN